MRIAIVVNNPARDLAGLILLAGELSRQGAKCYLVPMALQRFELASLAPDFVLFNQLRTLNEPIVQALIKAKIRIGLLDDEGGVFPNIDWYLRQLTPRQDIRQSVSVFCSWGYRLAEHARSNNWFPPEAVVATGHPRFDFYASEWERLAFPQAPTPQEYTKPLILINSRFSRANPAFGDREKEVRTMIKNRGFSEQEACNFQETMTRTLHGMVEMTNHLTQSFPQVTFVFRPHPFERLETYSELLQPRQNLNICRVGAITSWLRLADGVIHRSCTTAIEAAMCDVPAFSPAWIPFPDIIESTERVSVQCSSQEEMDDYLRKLLDHRMQINNNILLARQDVIRDWFYSVDGNAYQRTADAILSILRDKPKMRIDFEQCRELSRGHKASSSFLRKMLRNWRHETQREDAHRVEKWRQSSLFFDLLQVKEILQAIVKCQPNKIPNSIRVENAESVLDPSVRLHTVVVSS